MRPRAARVGGLVDAVAVRRHDAADGVLAHADVDDVRVGGRDRDRADRRGLHLAVGDVGPRAAAVGGLPDAAADAAEVERAGCCGTPATATTRPPRKGPMLRHCRAANDPASGEAGDAGCPRAGMTVAVTATRTARESPRARRWADRTHGIGATPQDPAFYRARSTKHDRDPRNPRNPRHICWQSLHTRDAAGRRRRPPGRPVCRDAGALGGENAREHVGIPH